MMHFKYKALVAGVVKGIESYGSIIWSGTEARIMGIYSSTCHINV